MEQEVQRSRGSLQTGTCYLREGWIWFIDASIIPALGKDHAEVARVLHNLGIFWYYQGKYEEAEQVDILLRRSPSQYYRRALKIYKEKLVDGDPDMDPWIVENTKNSLHEVLIKQGNEIEIDASNKNAGKHVEAAEFT